LEESSPVQEAKKQCNRRPVATPAGRVSDAASTSKTQLHATVPVSVPVRNTNHLPALTKLLRKLKSQKKQKKNKIKKWRKNQSKEPKREAGKTKGGVGVGVG